MSRRTRVYLPLSADDVAELAANGVLPQGDRVGFAVTAGLRAAAPGADDEELEYVATQSAAQYAQLAEAARAVVAAADVDATSLHAPDAAGANAGGGDAASGVVRITGVVRSSDLASLHVGDADAPADPDADLELSWYDISEVGAVRDLLSGRHGRR